MKISVFLLSSMMLLGSCSLQRWRQIAYKQKNAEFEQLDFDDVAKMYMKKETADQQSIEGIYSVSHLIVKKGKPFLSSTEKERVIDRKENYGRVAIFKDNGNTARDYFEVPLGNDRQLSYSIRGEFTHASEGSILIYKHFEPKKSVLTYTFVYDAEQDVLEGARTESYGNSVVTYSLIYVKLYPNKGKTQSINKKS